MVKKNHVQKKATAEVLVFEQNMLKKSAHTAMVLFRNKTCRKNKQPSPKHVCLVQKNAPKQKAAAPLCFSFPSKTCQNKKRTRRYTCDQKNATIPPERELTHFLYPSPSGSAGLDSVHGSGLGATGKIASIL